MRGKDLFVLRGVAQTCLVGFVTANRFPGSAWERENKCLVVPAPVPEREEQSDNIQEIY